MKKIIILCILFFPLKSFSQYHNNVWVFGNPSSYPNTIINFNNGSGSLSKSTDSSFNHFTATNATICDASGNLLFYSNGVNIYNSVHQIMQNGDNLNPCFVTTQDSSSGLSMPQGAIALPFPGKDSLFYLFHESSDLATLANWYIVPGKILYSIVNKNLNNGLGAVVAKNIVLHTDTFVVGQLSACKHANGRDWWLLTHVNESDLYYKWLITPDTIMGPYTQAIGSFIAYNNNGQTVFSPDGSKYVNYISLSDSSTNQHINVFDFDRCTGLLSNLDTIVLSDSSIVGFGCAISSNSRLLYLSNEYFVYQFDLFSANIPSSKTKVATYDGFTSPFYNVFYMMQLALDEKIYMTCGNGTEYLHIIDNPNALGLSCNVLQHNLQLLYYHAIEIPNQPYYNLGALTNSVCDTLTSVINHNANFDFSFIPFLLKMKLLLGTWLTKEKRFN
ncbi:MAG: hypothetical protein IPJ79_01120 [Bacteroidetes bacterium]|nr:hypothetical protein [Bacteroidota bacterium]